jgi:ABC-type Fe3+-hydroxamate transport system substrate-binding protein
VSATGSEGPRRIVSLVPSVTEALFALGLGERVVGVTDWCVHPAAAVAGLPRVGGTKDTDVEAVVALAPDLVLANREENTERTVRRLREAGLPVRVSYPRTVAEGVALLAELAALGASAEARDAVVEPARRALAEARAGRPASLVRVFCPIWRDPWMAVSGDTYAHDLLVLCGAENPWAGARRRYPVVTRAEVEAARPDLVLLPDEPYAFAPADQQELLAWDLPAARAGRIHLIDGTLVSWYGPRIPRAIETIRLLLSSAECP